MSGARPPALRARRDRGPASALALVGLAVLAASAPGCARNAVLDLDVVIPAQPSLAAGRRHAFVEIGTGFNGFEEQVLGLEGATDVDVATIVGPSERLTFSVVASDPGAELRVRVRYCRTERCDDPSDVLPFEEGTEPGLRWTFERAFYVGQRTSYELAVPALVAGAESVDPRTVCRCAVIGCATVAPGTSSCRGTTNVCDRTARHFCE